MRVRHCDAGHQQVGVRSRPQDERQKEVSANAPPSNPIAIEEEQLELPSASLELYEYQLDRIWSMLSLENKALGIVNALNADRE